MSKKRKCPWITYNGKNIADSQFCIDYLNKEFGNDTMSKYSPRERAEGVAFRKLVEESLYWYTPGQLAELQTTSLVMHQLFNSSHFDCESYVILAY